jgi:hypothetical protein
VCVGGGLFLFSTDRGRRCEMTSAGGQGARCTRRTVPKAFRACRTTRIGVGGEGEEGQCTLSFCVARNMWGRGARGFFSPLGASGQKGTQGGSSQGSGALWGWLLHRQRRRERALGGGGGAARRVFAPRPPIAQGRGGERGGEEMQSWPASLLT